MWYQSIWGQIPLAGTISKRQLAKLETDMEWINNLERLLNLELDIFQWNNLPLTCNERFLELSLLLEGTACIVKKENNYINLLFKTGGCINLYGEPLMGFGYGLNGWHEQFTLYVDGVTESNIVSKGSGGVVVKNDYNAVMCRDNKTCYPFINYIIMASKRLTESMRTTDIIRTNQKSPMLLTCPKSMKKQLEDILFQKEINKPYILVNNVSELENIKTLDFKADPNALNTAWEDFQRVKAEIEEILGINSNPNEDKKERLLVDEINSNNQSVMCNVNHRLFERQLFCERVNKAFGLNISVELKNKKEVDNYDVGYLDGDSNREGIQSTQNV